MPYRIRRRPESSSAVRQQLTDEVSSLLARMAFHQAWLQIEARPSQGPTRSSWPRPARKPAPDESRLAAAADQDRRGDEPRRAYPRDRSTAARAACIEVMRRHL